MTGEPVKLHFKDEVEPHAVHTPIPVPHHWKTLPSVSIDPSAKNATNKLHHSPKNPFRTEPCQKYHSSKLPPSSAKLLVFRILSTSMGIPAGSKSPV